MPQCLFYLDLESFLLLDRDEYFFEFIFFYSPREGLDLVDYRRTCLCKHNGQQRWVAGPV